MVLRRPNSKDIVSHRNSIFAVHQFLKHLAGINVRESIILKISRELIFANRHFHGSKRNLISQIWLKFAKFSSRENFFPKVNNGLKSFFRLSIHDSSYITQIHSIGYISTFPQSRYQTSGSHNPLTRKTNSTTCPEQYSDVISYWCEKGGKDILR